MAMKKPEPSDDLVALRAEVDRLRDAMWAALDLPAREARDLLRKTLETGLDNPKTSFGRRREAYPIKGVHR